MQNVGWETLGWSSTSYTLYQYDVLHSVLGLGVLPRSGVMSPHGVWTDSWYDGCNNYLLNDLYATFFVFF